MTSQMGRVDLRLRQRAGIRAKSDWAMLAAGETPATQVATAVARVEAYIQRTARVRLVTSDAQDEVSIWVWGVEVLRMNRTTGCVASRVGQRSDVARMAQELARIWASRRATLIKQYVDLATTDQQRELLQAVAACGRGDVGEASSAQMMLLGKALQAAMATVLDQEVVRLTRHSAHDWRFDDYNDVAWHKPFFQRVRREQPALLPLALAYVRELPQRLRWAADKPSRYRIAIRFDGLRRELLDARLIEPRHWRVITRMPLRESKLVLQPGRQWYHLEAWREQAQLMVQPSAHVP